MSGNMLGRRQIPRRAIPGYEALVGVSPQIVEVRKVVSELASVDSPVLITGETGVGKELVARLLYRTSSRAGKPFVALNCAALPDSLVESELFGHERGAFTGAERLTIGQLEYVDGGTVLLDEVGEMKLEVQAKLLRALDSGEIYRVGSRHMVRVDVRVLAATNRDVKKLVKEGGLRADLYYRLKVGEVHIPPLRERPEDVLPLVACFLQELGARASLQPPSLTRKVRRILESYPWPGNVRELRNVMEIVMMRRPGRSIELVHLPVELKHDTHSPQRERDRLLAVLEQTRWNKKYAAEKLGWARSTLYLKLKEYAIE